MASPSETGSSVAGISPPATALATAVPAVTTAAAITLTTAVVGPSSANQHIEVDIEEVDAGDDADSALGDDTISSTASIGSSILKYRQENGRTYHAYKDGSYLIPNDDSEQQRLDLQHNLCLITLENRLHLSPLPSVLMSNNADAKKGINRVLDVGTGTGIWAIDFADEHPEATVIGVDLSPIQPNFVPPNVQFQIDDIEEDWTFHEPFDFIYSRQMTGALCDWPSFFRRSFEHLRPGGWLEMFDITPLACDDDSCPEGSAMREWMDHLVRGMQSIGRPITSAYDYKKQMEAQGFVHVQQVVYKWPQNQWPKDPKLKEMGAWQLENISTGLHGLSSALFTRVLGWTPAEMELLLARVRKEIRNPKMHVYWPMYCVYGQKPSN